jgi:hypothetical protein
MKDSTRIYNEIETRLARLREIDAEAAKCQPITRSWPLSTTEKAENHRRITRLDQIAVERAKIDGEYAALRRQCANAMAAEQAPAPSGPAPIKSTVDIPKLKKQIAEAEAAIAELPEQRRRYVVAASRGDRKALEALDKIAAGEQKAQDTIALATAAIAEIESQNAEIQREFAERDADAKVVAAQSAAAKIIAHDRETDSMMRALAEHLVKRPALLRAVRKTGCEIDDPRMNVLSTVEVLHRAAKAAGLADILQISIRDAVPLEEASRMLLKLAIHRPTVAQLAATKAA